MTTKEPVIGLERTTTRRSLLATGAATVPLLAMHSSGSAALPTASSTQRRLHAAQTDGELIVGHHVDPVTLDLLDSTTAAFQSVSAHIVEQLVIFETETLDVIPWLAESFEWIDGTTLEIRLREGISFTNGEPLDGEAVRVSLDRLTSSEAYSFFLEPDVYQETQIIDDLTVHVLLSRPYAPFVGFLARGGAVVPPVYYQDVGTEGFGQEPIGTGPFVLSEWIHDDHITLTRNEEYWNGQHPLATITYRVIPEDTARVAALTAGEIHIALNVPVSGVSQIEESDGNSVVTTPGLRKFATFFDTRSADPETLGDVRVRTALNMAVDKVAIAESVFEGAAVPLQGQWQVEGEPGFNPDISMFEYNPEEAMRLLTEAGYPDGFELQLTYTVGRYPMDTELGQIVASYLEQVGITVNQRPLEYGAFLNVRDEETIGTHQWGLLYPPVPHFNYTTFVSGSPYEFHALPPEYTELVSEAVQETDEEAQMAIYAQCAQIMHDEAMALFLISPNDNYGVSDQVQGFLPRRDQVLWLFDVTLAE